MVAAERTGRHQRRGAAAGGAQPVLEKKAWPRGGRNEGRSSGLVDRGKQPPLCTDLDLSRG